uniref:Expression site-associated protein n=1 Tax=Trypanosoma brucei TaxID=5691 RepID=Q26745_9TRYP|nr:expression site-associated protein [Trypanosoma brucei]
MNLVTVELVALLFFVTCIDGQEENKCMSVTDYKGDGPLSEIVCHVSCLSDALNKLYTDGERKMLVNEEVYANASRILDDMEGKTGESTEYLSVISGVMESKHDKLEKLISYGNEMGNLVAKAGGLFSEVNESVRAVRKEIPGALIKVNKYYTAIAEITRTVWSDVAVVNHGDEAKCTEQKFRKVGELQTKCVDHTCPLSDDVNEGTLQKYKDGCLDINVAGGSVSECLNLPRNKLYKSGGRTIPREAIDWHDHRDEVTYFQLKLQVKSTFTPLIAPFAPGQPPSALLALMSNITSLYSHFNKVHNNFTSLLVDTNRTDNLSSTHYTI